MHHYQVFLNALSSTVAALRANGGDISQELLASVDALAKTAQEIPAATVLNSQSPLGEYFDHVKQILQSSQPSSYSSEVNQFINEFSKQLQKIAEYPAYENSTRTPQPTRPFDAYFDRVREVLEANKEATYTPTAIITFTANSPDQNIIVPTDFSLSREDMQATAPEVYNIYYYLYTNFYGSAKAINDSRPGAIHPHTLTVSQDVATKEIKVKLDDHVTGAAQTFVSSEASPLDSSHLGVLAAPLKSLLVPQAADMPRNDTNAFNYPDDGTGLTGLKNFMFHWGRRIGDVNIPVTPVEEDSLAGRHPDYVVSFGVDNGTVINNVSHHGNDASDDSHLALEFRILREELTEFYNQAALIAAKDPTAIAPHTFDFTQAANGQLSMVLSVKNLDGSIEYLKGGTHHLARGKFDDEFTVDAVNQASANAREGLDYFSQDYLWRILHTSDQQLASFPAEVQGFSRVTYQTNELLRQVETPAVSEGAVEASRDESSAAGVLAEEQLQVQEQAQVDFAQVDNEAGIFHLGNAFKGLVLGVFGLGVKAATEAPAGSPQSRSGNGEFSVNPTAWAVGVVASLGVLLSAGYLIKRALTAPKQIDDIETALPNADEPAVPEAGKKFAEMVAASRQNSRAITPEAIAAQQTAAEGQQRGIA